MVEALEPDTFPLALDFPNRLLRFNIFTCSSLRKIEFGSCFESVLQVDFPESRSMNIPYLKFLFESPPPNNIEVLKFNAINPEPDDELLEMVVSKLNLKKLDLRWTQTDNLSGEFLLQLENRSLTHLGIRYVPKITDILIKFQDTLTKFKTDYVHIEERDDIQLTSLKKLECSSVCWYQNTKTGRNLSRDKNLLEIFLRKAQNLESVTMQWGEMIDETKWEKERFICPLIVYYGWNQVVTFLNFVERELYSMLNTIFSLLEFKAPYLEFGVLAGLKGLETLLANNLKLTSEEKSNGCRIDFKSIAKITSLTRLSLNGTGITEEDCLFLMDNLENLKSFWSENPWKMTKAVCYARYRYFQGSSKQETGDTTDSNYTRCAAGLVLDVGRH
eukprot:sb/3465555/